MVMQLFGHPFSSYTWKALLAFHETGTPFEFRMLDGEHADNGAKFSAAWPVSKFPLLINWGPNPARSQHHRGICRPGDDSGRRRRGA